MLTCCGGGTDKTNCISAEADLLEMQGENGRGEKRSRQESKRLGMMRNARSVDVYGANKETGELYYLKVGD